LRKKQEALREKIRFQFENLKSQINPHFLFNSFSTLIALIESNTEDAVEYTQELSNLFRNILEYKDHDVIPLLTELQVVDNYIKLQKKRFGENLQIKIHEISGFKDLLIPPLTIQLLIENAVKHNIVSKNKPLQIDLIADVEKGYLYIKNNLQAKDGDTDSTGIGITNIVSRYRILTDKKVEIIESDTEFIVGLPFILKS
jgi:LytS/YehU family sensor histidine kinase